MSRKFSCVLTKGEREGKKIGKIGKMGGICGKYTSRVLFWFLNRWVVKSECCFKGRLSWNLTKDGKT